MTITRSVATGTDDAFQDYFGNVSLDDHMDNLGVNGRWIGFRFLDVAMPPGSFILDLHLEVIPGNLRKPGVQIYIQLAGTVDTFIDNDHDISSRRWALDPGLHWSSDMTVGMQGQYISTPNLRDEFLANTLTLPFTDHQALAFLMERVDNNQDLELHMFEDDQGPTRMVLHVLGPDH